MRALSNEARLELQKLADAGNLTPRATVDAARDPANPLHEQFEWDNGIAGEKFREQQARSLIRTVKLVITTEERTYRNSPGWIHDPTTQDQGYVSPISLRSDVDSARVAWRHELKQALSYIRRAGAIAAASEIDLTDDEAEACDEIEELLVGVISPSQASESTTEVATELEASA